MKENWFRICILIVVVFAVFVLYQSKIVKPQERQKQLEICIIKAQQERKVWSSEILKAWVEGKVDSDYWDDGQIEIKAIYNEQRSECYRLYD